ncbi:unnamed protein product [Linum trigynum]|uniref:RNase H type-1 domain-containing protein n=1 Tax=Linum trigynum TaxID=586398 RepID=A0AAV2E3I1_9ROSI
MSEWSVAQETTTARRRHGQSRAPPSPNTIPPPIPEGFMLVHFDGATKALVGGAIGFVGLSSQRAISFALGRFYTAFDHPFLIELMALRDDMRWCLSHSITNVLFCGDAQVVIRMIAANDSSHALGGAILKEVQVLRTSLARVSFHFAPCRYNRAAHTVAKHALSSMVPHLVDHRIVLFSFA